MTVLLLLLLLLFIIIIATPLLLYLLTLTYKAGTLAVLILLCRNRCVHPSSGEHLCQYKEWPGCVGINSAISIVSWLGRQANWHLKTMKDYVMNNLSRFMLYTCVSYCGHVTLSFDTAPSLLPTLHKFTDCYNHI